MRRVASAEKEAANSKLEKSRGDAADQNRMNSDLKPQKYSGRILGLICLRFNQLLALSEATDEGRAFNKALRDIEKRNLQSGCVLPKTYNLFTSTFSL